MFSFLWHYGVRYLKWPVIGSIIGFLLFDALIDVIAAADSSDQRLYYYQHTIPFISTFTRWFGQHLQDFPILYKVVHWLHYHTPDPVGLVLRPPPIQLSTLDPNGWWYWVGAKTHTLPVLETLAKLVLGLRDVLYGILGYLSMAFAWFMSAVWWVINFLAWFISYLWNLQSLHQLAHDAIANVYVDTPRQITEGITWVLTWIWSWLSLVLSWSYDPLIKAARITWRLLWLTLKDPSLTGDFGLSFIAIAVLAYQCTRFTVGLVGLVCGTYLQVNGITSWVLPRNWREPVDLRDWVYDVVQVSVAGLVAGLYGIELLNWECHGFNLFFDSLDMGLGTRVNSFELGLGEMLMNIGILMTARKVGAVLLLPRREKVVPREAYGEPAY